MGSCGTTIQRDLQEVGRESTLCMMDLLLRIRFLQSKCTIYFEWCKPTAESIGHGQTEWAAKAAKAAKLYAR